MTEPTHFEPPNFLSEQPHHKLAGDWNDDDGAAIDEYFEPAYHGEQEQRYVEGAKAALPTTNRLISRVVPLQFISTEGVSDPIQVLPADPNRTMLTIQNVSAAVGLMAVSVATDKTGCYGDPNLLFGPLPLPSAQFPGYTGAVWIKPVSALGDTPALEFTAIVAVIATTS